MNIFEEYLNKVNKVLEKNSKSLGLKELNSFKNKSLISFANLFGLFLFALAKTREILVDRSNLNFSGGISKFTFFNRSRFSRFKIPLLSKITLFIFDK